MLEVRGCPGEESSVEKSGLMVCKVGGAVSDLSITCVPATPTKVKTSKTVGIIMIPSVGAV